MLWYLYLLLKESSINTKSFLIRTILSIKQFNQIDNKIQRSLRDSRKIGISFVFMFLASFVAITFSEGNNNIILVFGVFVSAYMAMNIGANDVANNVGPAVGSKTMSIVVAIIIAAIFEAGGAIIAGGDVVGTIKSGIVSQDSFSDPKMFIALMMAALIAAAVWLNLATFMRAPVSTTHSIIGGLLGAGLAAGGFGIVNWKAMISIVASWFISPVLGGIVAAIFLMIIKRTITYKSDKIKASRIVVPILLFIMSLSFTLYLIQKGLSKIVKLDLYMQFVIAFLIAAIVFGLSKMWVNNKSKNLSNSKDSVADLFNIPLICAAALLSFAHGANDVANAIGPMAAINQALSGVVASKAHVPIWIMIIGGFGISLGLALYGPRLIKTVGSEITDIDKIRAFCVAMSASITVLIASSLGLPLRGCLLYTSDAADECVNV